MRILFTIPHFFNPDGGGEYGSLCKDPQPRIVALATCLAALHQLFGSVQYGFSLAKDQVFYANQCKGHEIDIVICTTRGMHLLDRIKVSPDLYKHCPTDVEPMLLGFECQAVLAEHIGQYDYYCFLEDDLILRDPWFFDKLRWFDREVGDRSLLQPNRFELTLTNPTSKLYVDGDLKPHLIPDFHAASEYPELTGRVMGRSISLQKAGNPHSGCYFLHAEQMAFWKSQPYFLDRDTSFIGPLESAATLGVMRAFRLYKPAPQDANFLEIQHFGTGMSNSIFEALGMINPTN